MRPKKWEGAGFELALARCGHDLSWRWGGCVCVFFRGGGGFCKPWRARCDFPPPPLFFYIIKKKKTTTNIRSCVFFIVTVFLHDNDHGMIEKKKGGGKGFFYESRQCKSQYLPKKVMGSLMPWKWFPSFKMKKVLGLGGPTKTKWHDWSLAWTFAIKSWLSPKTSCSSISSKMFQPSFPKSEDGWCDPKRCLEMDHGAIWGLDQRLFVFQECVVVVVFL